MLEVCVTVFSTNAKHLFLMKYGFWYINFCHFAKMFCGNHLNIVSSATALYSQLGSVYVCL